MSAGAAVSIVVVSVSLVVGRGQTDQAGRDALGGAQPDGTGTVTGVVLAADTSEVPVRRATVTLSRDRAAVGLVAVTDDQGRFTIEHTPTGTFSLTATKPGYLVAVYGATKPGRPGIPLNVAPGQRRDGIVLRMPQGGVISGAIRDERGQPQAEAPVFAFLLSEGGAPAPNPVTTNADDQGNYRLFGLAEGAYVVAASYARSPFASEAMAGSSAEVDAVLAALARRQTPDRSGHAPVSLPQVPVTTFARVFFPHSLNPSQAARIEVRPGGESSGIDIVLEMVRAVSVGGTVVAPTATVPPLVVRMVRRDEALAEAISAEPVRQLPSGPDGRFRFIGVSPGSYTILVQTHVTAGTGPTESGPAALWARSDVDVAGEDVSGITLMLQPALYLTGRVVTDARPGVQAPELAKLTVSLWNAAGPPLARASPYGLGAIATSAATAVVRSDGTFDVLGLAAGAYVLTVSSLPTGWHLRSAMLGNQDIVDVPVEVAYGAGDLPHVIVTLSVQPAGLVGTVSRVGADAPVERYAAVVFPVARALWRSSSRRIRAAWLASDWTYRMEDLAPGEYFVGVFPDIDAESFLDLNLLDRIAPACRRVVLTEGETKIQNLGIGGLPK